MEARTPEDLYQISLLIDQLKHDDPQLRVNACKNLVLIARALGAERTRTELIPFLTESLDDEDEVLQVLAEQLRELLDLMGGPEYAYILLKPLETLIMVEENNVREAAVRSMEAVLNSLSNEQLAEQYLPLLTRLATNDWFASRMSSAALFHICYKKLSDPLKMKCRSLFLKLCSDETPMVRRTAAINFGKMAKLVKLHELNAEFITPLAALADDEQDSVRIQVIPMCISLAEILPLEAKMSQILPIILNVANDRSWRVRWALASSFHEVCGSLGQQISNNSLSSAFEVLLNDTEAEVRAAAASRLVLVCGTLRKDVIVSQILPAASRLAGDVSEHVRAALAMVVSGMAAIVGRDASVEYVLPILLLLLRDETSDVRLNIISSLDTVNSVIGVELLSQSLLPAVVDLAEDPKWRVRMAIIENIPMLGQQLGKAFFSEKLNNLCLTCLGDDVYSVRRLAAANLENLCVLFGEDWCCTHIIPRIQKMHSHTNYLQRMTSLYGIQVLCGKMARGTVESLLFPMVVSLSADPVPNVRFTVAKTFEVLLKAGLQNQTVLDDVDAALHALSTDSDRDVRFFALKALEAYSRRLDTL